MCPVIHKIIFGAMQEETRAKLAQINRVQQLQEEKPQLPTFEDIQLSTQLAEVRKKFNEGMIQYLEEMREEVQRDLENCLQSLRESMAENEQLVQAKQKLQQGVRSLKENYNDQIYMEDATTELENVRTAFREVKKRQKEFDMLLAEERAKVRKVGGTIFHSACLKRST
uniref:Myosin_tail_1 domain-containing protein n=1 Tax=Angiostrongylus cantonensis TaxID=6313 RepID=A0A0K0DDN1_ANGCA